MKDEMIDKPKINGHDEVFMTRLCLLEQEEIYKRRPC